MMTSAFKSGCSTPTISVSRPPREWPLSAIREGLHLGGVLRNRSPLALALYAVQDSVALGPPCLIETNVKNPSADSSLQNRGQVVAAPECFLIANGVHSHPMVMNYRRKGPFSLGPTEQSVGIHTSNAVLR